MSFGLSQWVNEPELIERNNGHKYITITKDKVCLILHLYQ